MFHAKKILSRGEAISIGFNDSEKTCAAAARVSVF
jgi:hypothetical protein